MIVFVLGRPGSGKSTSVRFMQELAEKVGWSVSCLNDYTFLQNMFQSDTQHRFRPVKHGGFEILDSSVRDTALHRLEQNIQKLSFFKEEKMLVTVEFARSDYEEAMKLFNSASLYDAHFLFIAADLPACSQRLQQRIRQPTTEDDYNVSASDIGFTKRYASQYMPPHLVGKKIDIIDNTDGNTLNDLEARLKAFLKRTLVEQEQRSNPWPTVVTQSITEPLLNSETFMHRDTEPLPNIEIAAQRNTEPLTHFEITGTTDEGTSSQVEEKTMTFDPI